MTSAFRAVLLFVALWLANSSTNIALGQTVHFLVAERPEFATHGDSYVLPLTDMAAIDHARALITAPPGDLSSIVIARIAAGADGVNRDHLAPGAPPWSWHVTEFVEFADFAAEILDGWPTFVESDVEGWIANTGGMIGFWNYTVITELPLVPEPASGALVALACGWLLFWRRRRI
jgi:hypothetical protein